MVKVALVRCPDYNFESVLPAVRRAVNLIGGMGGFVKTGENILLNPNLLSARPPEDAVDTHPSVVRAVIRLVRESGGVVTLGDDPGGFSDTRHTEKVYEISGMNRLAREEGVRLVKFKSGRQVDEFPIADHVLDADRIISIPKLKTHDLTILTAGIKNVFGTISGPYKLNCHLRAPKGDAFAKILAKVYKVVRPGLTILDGVVAMEGNGPSSGILRSMKLIMASGDAVALDSVLAVIIGLKPFDIPAIKEAAALGAGEADLEKIEILGEPLGTVVTKDYKLPKIKLLKRIPWFAARMLTSLIRFKPFIHDDLCRRCDMCRQSCPADCISVREKRYIIDYSRCINCFCCKEMCPHQAISLKKNFLAKIILE